MLPFIPDAVIGAGAMAIFAFALLGLMAWVVKGQQAYIYNHLTSNTKALGDLTHSIERLKDSIDRLGDKLP